MLRSTVMTKAVRRRNLAWSASFRPGRLKCTDTVQGVHGFGELSISTVDCSCPLQGAPCVVQFVPSLRIDRHPKTGHIPAHDGVVLVAAFSVPRCAQGGNSWLDVRRR